MQRRQGSPVTGKEDNETLLINDLSKQMDFQVIKEFSFLGCTAYCYLDNLFLFIRL